MSLNSSASDIPGVAAAQPGVQTGMSDAPACGAALVRWSIALPAACALTLAGWSKWHEPLGVAALVEWSGVPRGMVLPFVRSLAGFELGLGLALLAGWMSLALVGTSLVLLASFSAFLVWVLSVGGPSGCGCFGANMAWASINSPGFGIARNALLIACLLPSLHFATKRVRSTHV